MGNFKLSTILGIHTRSGRNSRPLGALDDIQNLTLNAKTGKPTLRKGITADISTAVASVDSVTMATIDWYYRRQAIYPSKQSVDFLLGQDGSAGKWFFQKGWWNSAGTFQTTFLKYAESTSTTVASRTGLGVVLTAGSATDDYYKGWLIYDTTRGVSGYITGYTGSSKTATLAGTAGPTATAFAAGNSISLYRHFHDNRTFSPNYNLIASNAPPCLLPTGASFTISGGQSSTVGNKAIVSTYLDNTLSCFGYKGTYISEAEVKTSDSASMFQNVSGVATTVGSGLTEGVRWFLCWVLETVDGQKTVAIKPATDYLDPLADYAITEEVRIYPTLNKRFRYATAFMGYANQSATSLYYSEYFYIDQIDLTTRPMTVDESTTQTYWKLTTAPTFNINDWNTRGVDLESYLGIPEPTGTTASFSLGNVVSGRVFIAKYYDYVLGQNVEDYIRYSGFGDGIPQYNVLADVDDYTQSRIGSDGTYINGIPALENNMLIIKSIGAYWLTVSEDPLQWEAVTVSMRIGGGAIRTIIETPWGILWANPGDDIYLWNRGEIVSLAKNWLLDFQGLSTANPEKWLSWYDTTYKSFRLKCDTSSEGTFYEMLFEVPVDNTFAFVKHVLPYSIAHVDIRRTDNVPHLVKLSSALTYYFGGTTDDGAQIAPYFDTGEYVLDEDILTLVTRWYLNCEQTGTPTGALDCTFLIDNTSVGTFTSLTTTNVRFSLPMPIATPLGSRIRFKFNTNATKATFGTAFTIDEFGADVRAIPWTGDASKKI